MDAAPEARSELAVVGAPAAVFTTVRPLEGSTIVYEPLAPRIAGAAADAQLSIDALIKNNQTTAIDVDQVRLSYTGGGARPADTLETGMKKVCTGESATDLTADRTIAPGETCRLVLTPDLKLALPAPAQVKIEVFFTGFTLPISETHALAAHHNAPAAGSYRFPAHAEDLPAGQFWTAQSSGAGSHHRTSVRELYAYDAGLVRWNGSAWTNLKPGTTGDNNSDYLVWGQPIYAMADGTVQSFDNTRDDNVPGVESSNANFFRIQHGSELGEYFHLKKGSLNPALMTAGAAVKAGDFLGLAGNSGHSSEPHLHVDVVGADNVARPLLFNQAFVVDRAAPNTTSAPELAPFSAMNDQGLPWEKDLVWPSPFHRVDEAAGGAISTVAIAHASASRAVTASRTSTGNLELESWDVASTGVITARDVETAGGASEIAIAQSSDVLTAFRNSVGNLELITWDLDGAAAITKNDEATAGAVSKVAVTAQPDGSNGVVTAFRDASGDLGLIAWDVSLTGQITRRGEAGAGAISQVAITTTQIACDCVVTAVRNSSGNLQLTSWQVTGAKNFVRIDDEEGGAISDVALTSVQMSNTSQFVVAGVRDSIGNLELIVYEVTSTGQLVRHGEANAGVVSDVSLGSDGVRQLVSTVRTSGNALKLIGWEVTAAGDVIREGEDSAGTISNVSLSASFSAGGKKFALPAMRDASGNLRLISWQTNL